MHALVKGAVAASLLGGAGFVLGGGPQAPAPPPVASVAAPVPSLVEMPCPPRHVPEGEACVPLPELAAPPGDDVFRERKGRGAAVDVLPRRPDRPADPAALRYPLASEPLVLRGFDEAVASDVSPMSIELAAERGAVVSALVLDGQVGATKVAAVGRLVGNSVVTSHVVGEGDQARTYLLVHGHLDAAAPDVAAGKELAAGAQLGFVGDSGNPGFVSLYLEARVVRVDSGDISKLDAKRLCDASISVPSDARNVLPRVTP
jgi:hypothetical protein